MTISPEALGIGLLFERVPDAVIVNDVETGRIVLWNPAAETIFGYGAEEVIGMPFEALLPESLKGAYRARMAEVRQRVAEGSREAMPTFEVGVNTKAGELVVLEVSLSPVSHPNTQAGLALVIARELTEQRNFMRELLTNLPAGMAYYGPDLRIRLANAEYARIFHRPLEDTIGKHVLEVFGESGRVLADVLTRIFETGEAINSFNLAGTYTYNGETYAGVWDVTRNPVFDENGAVVGVVVLMQDVTERARLTAEIERRTEELAEQKALTERLIQHTPVTLSYIDRNLIYRWNNPLHSSVVGVPQEQLIGRHVSEVMPPEALEKTLELYQRVLASREPHQMNGLSLVWKEFGRPTFWDVSYIPVAEDDEVTGILILAVDASSRVEIERLQQAQIDQLQQVDRMKDQFLSILSHELRTPLNAILGFASILDDELVGTLTPDQHRYMHKILGGTEVLLALINDLLDMSRIQAGKFQLKPGPMDFRKVAHRAMGHLTALAEQKGQTLWLEVPEQLGPLRADEQRVEQVLMNLVGNAIKFTPEGGRITVKATAEGGKFRCEVSDNGIGIAPHHQARLFQPFTQVDGSNTRAVGGTGLGLSITKALIEAHGGTVGVESTPGVGSTFWFTLPQA